MGSCTGRCVCGEYCSSSDDFCQVHSCDKQNGWKCGKEQKSWKNNDELFFKELKEGHQWQQLPALFLKLHGLSVEVPELKIRSSIKEANRWINAPDLLVNGYVIEVKSRNESFISGSTYPYETVFVDTVSGYNAKEIKPLAYIIISRPTGAMVVLKTLSSKGWNIESKFDHVRKIKEDFYVCKPKHLQTLDVLISYIKNNEKTRITQSDSY